MRSVLAWTILAALAGSADAGPPEYCSNGLYPFAITATPLAVTEAAIECRSGPMLGDGCVMVRQRRDCATSTVTIDGVPAPAAYGDPYGGDLVTLTVCGLTPGPHVVATCARPDAPPLDCAIDLSAGTGGEVSAIREDGYQLRVRVDEVLSGPADWRGTERTFTVPYGCDLCPPVDPASATPISLQWNDDVESPWAGLCVARPPPHVDFEPHYRGCGCTTGGGDEPALPILAMLTVVALRRRRA